MKVSSERLQDSQVSLQIEVEPERSAKSRDQAYQRLVNRISIPGFRKGRAPRHVVERMIGREALAQESMELLLPEIYREAVAETGIKPVEQPHVDVVQEEPLVVKVTVAVRPEVELPDYHDVHTEPDQVTVREDEVDATLERLREQHAEWLPVERGIATGDLVNLDVTGTVRGAPVLYGASGQAILDAGTGEPIIDQKAVDYRVTPESENPVAGFAEQLIGLQSGEEKRFELTFPPNYPDQQLANKSVIFRAKIHSIKEQKLSDLDDEFAKTVGDYETFDALRQRVREQVQRHKEDEAKSNLRARVLRMVADRSRLELPNVLIERETDHMVERVERRLRNAEVELSSYLRSIKKDQQQMRADFRVDAIANLRRHFVLDEVAKREQIEVTPEEIDAEIRAITSALGEHAGKTAEALRRPEQREDLAEDLRRRKALDRLVAIATGQSGEQPAAPAAPTDEEEAQ